MRFARESEYVDIDLRIVHMTSGALLLTDDDGVEEWVPRVAIEYGDIYTADQIGSTETISIQQYWAERKGFV